ncbi:hypothetical protein ACVXG7_16420 [Enterobacter hormaechei]
MKATAFIDVLMLNRLRAPAHLQPAVWSGLHKVNVVRTTAPAGKMGNKNGKLPSLALRISALFELFTAFFARMRNRRHANQFPTLQGR